MNDNRATTSVLAPPRTIRVLMVTDGEASFDRADFGLATVVDVLEAPALPWARVEVTKAHRERNLPALSADLPAFRFDRHDLSAYDQIWMFAVARGGRPPLEETELRAVAEFMDGGGGVFATGDHEDLGVSMCGGVPRVRSMRKWHWPDPGPNGEPVAPSIDGPDRRDTLSEGHDPLFQLNDQSDDVPQVVTPRMYATSDSPRWAHQAHPHPLLCGPRGPIRVLPDHPHEGECYVPDDLGRTFTFDGYDTAEYPGGLAPEVVAWSTIAARPAELDPRKGRLNARTSGAVGAYDGHRAGVGRVAVDATWHHFFNVNLVGDPTVPQDPVKSVGFAASAAGLAAFEEIKTYYRNIAVWLARPATQEDMWWRAVWAARWHHRVSMDLRPGSLGAPDLPELLRIGAEVREVLAATATRADALQWAGRFGVGAVDARLWEELRPSLDPWLPRAGDEQPGHLPNLVSSLLPELVLDAVLGAVVHAVAAEFPEPTEQARERVAGVDWAAVVRPALGRALEAVAGQVARTDEVLRSVGTTLAAAGGRERG
ncbi:hypothetical protein [Saccharothrix syringae]|uniref:Uncharacterized protein n=1 Tax=Saccharothrix syringae TaxID=103733 RepID=A0A5Q0H0Q8_SACSY|nr:hypothetical protein [Saccharothrix syringae]QFZ19444.1 hypothetical protein EKG83_20150 [Saccharothrix syringae]